MDVPPSPQHVPAEAEAVPDSPWPDRLRQLGTELGRNAGSERDREIIAGLWILIQLKLRQHVLAQCRRLGWITPEELEDLVSEKALDLIRRIDSREWKVAEASSGEIVRFIASVARNGLVDHLRGRSRTTTVKRSLIQAEAPRAPGARPPDPPDAPVARERLTQALLDCLESVKPKHRLIWMFRTFYDMSSAEIARHPEITLEPGNVDVILSRSRAKVGDCMRQKGFSGEDLSPGCFTAVWTALRLPSLLEGEAQDE